MIGAPNRGLNAMFTMMNTARLGVAVQGLGLIETSYQNAAAYARDRLQMRSLSGPKFPDKPADPIIVHPDVRRMLLTQRAIAEGGRALCIHAATLVDLTASAKDPAERQHADELLNFLTPIAKAFMTELAIEATYNGVQVLGGHGYIREWGLEQLARDARITTIYEGTTQIQANDLLGRKILSTGGIGLKHFLAGMLDLITANQTRIELLEFLTKLGPVLKEWEVLTREVAVKAKDAPEEIGAAAVDYLFYSGYAALGCYWLRQVEAVTRPSFAGTADFKTAKLALARFYYDRLLIRTQLHAAGIRAGAASLMALDEAAF
jgi:hypothetical protein